MWLIDVELRAVREVGVLLGVQMLVDKCTTFEKENKEAIAKSREHIYSA
jgi:hypothetical protein